MEKTEKLMASGRKMKPVKYSKGTLVLSFEALRMYIDNGNWLYLRDRLIHPRFIEQMSFKTICQFMDRYSLSLAIKEGEVVDAEIGEENATGK